MRAINTAASLHSQRFQRGSGFVLSASRQWHVANGVVVTMGNGMNQELVHASKWISANYLSLAAGVSGAIKASIRGVIRIDWLHCKVGGV
jgi:hypothetical protein